MKRTALAGWMFLTVIWSAGVMAEERGRESLLMNDADQCLKLDVNDIRSGRLDAIKARVHAGADVNCPIPESRYRDEYDRPLAWALSRPRLEIVQYLVSQGAVIEDVSRRRGPARSALEVIASLDGECRDESSRRECMEVADFLLDSISEPTQEILGKAFVTAAKNLWWHDRANEPAAPLWHAELMRELIKRGLDPKGIHMRYAVHHAVRVPRTLALLFSEFNANADLDAETLSVYGYDETFKPPIIDAAEQQNHEAVRVLLSHGANPNKQNSRGNFPLHIAAKLGDTQTVEYLLAAKADPSMHDEAGRSPLFYARQGRHQATLDLFAKHGFSIEPAEEQAVSRQEAARAAEQRAARLRRKAQTLGRLVIVLLVFLAWAAYLGSVIWASGDRGQDTALSTPILKLNLWAGPILAAIALGALAGLAFTAMFSTSHGGYPAIANGIPVGIGAGLVTLAVLAVLNYFFRGNSTAVALAAPVLSVGFPVGVVMVLYG